MKNKFTLSNQSELLTGQALYGIRIILQTADFLIEMLIFLLEDSIFLQKFLVLNAEFTEME